MAKVFNHLHCHFDKGSCRDSVLNTHAAFIRAKENKCTALAVTDHGSISAWVDADMYSHENGINIKPIYGVEMYEADDTVKYYHSVFLAKDREGLKFIQEMVTASYDYFYYKPRIPVSWLKEHKEQAKDHIIWLSACLAGRIPKYLLNHRDKEAEEYLDTMIDIFGRENVFIEVQNHGIKEETDNLCNLVTFAKKHNVRIVATNDCHYLDKDDSIARDIMIARSRGYTLNNLGSSDNSEEDAGNTELYFKTYEEMQKVIPFEEALKNTELIADMVEDMSLITKDEPWHYPEFPIEGGKSPEEFFAQKVMEGVNERYPVNTMSEEERTSLYARAKEEIDVICGMNAASYMLIDADFTVAAKGMGCKMGPGRGSACGSVAAYALRITDVEPIRYELFFERFMNKERISMPDIDSDFQDTKRYMALDYVIKKYGADHVARIITFGQVAARMAVRDTAAVLGIDPVVADKVAKLIPQEPKMTIDKALNENRDLAELYNENETVKKLIDLSKKIEGVIRQTGSHAAGLIISDKPLTNYGALYKEEGSDIPVFCYDMKSVEYLHLIKFDFLGLKTISVIDDTINMIRQDTGRNFNEDDIPLDDKEVYSYIATGDTAAVFQLESPGMQDFMRQLKPTNIEDLILGVSVYRPGPMDSIPDIVAGKQNPASIEYAPDTKDFLSPILDITYGQMVYQEQIMSICRDLAGYTFGRADLIRRAMSKKKTDVMEYERYIFIYGEVICPDCGGTGLINGEKCINCNGKGKTPAHKKCPWCNGEDSSCNHCHGTGEVDTIGEFTVQGCRNNGISVESANNLYNKIDAFANYAFNKSHATAYALIGYRTAWLKYHYPRQYMTAYLNSLEGDNAKIKSFISVVKKMGIPVLPPTLESKRLFTENEDGIRMGLSSIQSVGKSAEPLIEACENHNFTDLNSFLSEVALGKSDFEKLAMTGVFDTFGETRATLVKNAEKIAKASKDLVQRKNEGQISLFDTDDNMNIMLDITKYNEFPKLDILNKEKELTGFYLSGHPLLLPEYSPYVKRSNITTADEFTDNDHRRKVVLVGIISYDEKKEGVCWSKKGTKYLNFSLSDVYSDIKVMAFKECAENDASKIVQNAVVEVRGTLSVENSVVTDADGNDKVVRSIKIIADEIHSLKKLSSASQLWVKLNNATEHIETEKLISRYPGNDLLISVWGDKPKVYFVGICNELEEKLKTFIGAGNIVVRSGEE